MTRETILKALLTAAAAVAALSLAFPLYVHNPLHLQGARELQVAMLIARVQPWTEVATGIAGLVALALLPRRSRRALLTAGLLTAFIALDHVDIYSLIFHRLDRPQFEAAGRSGADGREKVLAVKVGTTARAYPVRILAYHHVVNDVAGGVALAATW